MNPDLLHLSTTLGQLLRAQGATVTVAESCTGGGVGAAITAVPGSSDYFTTGFITYSNDSKQRWLKVDPQLIETRGAVSAEVADAMAAGSLQQADADYAVAITGVAGPGGGTAHKPTGSVWLAWRARQGGAVHELCHFHGDREAVREQSIIRALAGLVALARAGEET